jgi:hypothetical protein
MENVIKDIKEFIDLIQIFFANVINVLIAKPTVLLLVIVLTVVGGKGFKFKVGDIVEVKR